MTTIIAIVALLLAAAPAWAFDAEQTTVLKVLAAVSRTCGRWV